MRYGSRSVLAITTRVQQGGSRPRRHRPAGVRSPGSSVRPSLPSAPAGSPAHCRRQCPTSMPSAGGGWKVVASRPYPSSAGGTSRPGSAGRHPQRRDRRRPVEPRGTTLAASRRRAKLGQAGSTGSAAASAPVPGRPARHEPGHLLDTGAPRTGDCRGRPVVFTAWLVSHGSVWWRSIAPTRGRWRSSTRRSRAGSPTATTASGCSCAAMAQGRRPTWDDLPSIPGPSRSPVLPRARRGNRIARYSRRDPTGQGLRHRALLSPGSCRTDEHVRVSE